MKGKLKTFFANKTLTAVIALLLVFICAVVIFGIRYDRMVTENTKLNTRLSYTQSAYSSLQQQANDDQAKASSNQAVLQQQNNDLQQKNKDLTNEVSSLKVMRQQMAAANANHGKGQAATIDPKNTALGSLEYFSKPNEGSKICYLTFDDGPSPNTLKILDVLNRGNAKATFFAINTSYVAYLKNIVAQGSAVGIHTYTHNFSTVYKNATAYYDDLTKMRNTIKNITGQDVTIMRFPGGSSNAVSKKYCNGLMTFLTKDVGKKGYTYFDWNVDSGDAGGTRVPTKKLISNVMRYSKNKSQICLLMHDAGAKTTTVEALPYIISYLRSQGFRFEVLTPASATFHHSGLNN